jgi:hypothetical protein
MMRRSAWLGPALGLVLFGVRSASATDYWDLATIPDNSLLAAQNNLVHGASQQHDLQANPGPVTDVDCYIATDFPRSSFEAVVDAAGADLIMQDNLNFQRFDSQGLPLQTSEQTDVGSTGNSLAMRWQSTGTTIQSTLLRVQSLSCGPTCGPEDQYRIRFYDTTIAVPRFNNAAGQVTVLIVQNPTGWTRNIAGTVYFYGATGALLGSTTFSLPANAALVLNTATVPNVAGASGTITIAHDGGYGNLAVKSVALDPATGFSFDSPGLYKPQ